MKIIEVKELNKNIKGKKVLENINFSLEGGYTYKLVGNNGCGKTTLIKCILGFTADDSCAILNNAELNKGKLFYK